MTNYPNADNSPGYNYDPDPGNLAYNNARSSGSFTCANATTTTITDSSVRAGDTVVITATNAKGALVITGVAPYPLAIYVSSVVAGSFVVSHDDDAGLATAATFNYVVFPSS